jgi:hypothetical protein
MRRSRVVAARVPVSLLGPLLACAVGFLAACGASSDDESSPAAVLEAYVDAINARDLDSLMALFDVDAAVTGHPADSTPASPARGLAETRTLEALTTERATGVDAYEASDVLVSGSTVMWTHLFHAARYTCVGNDEIAVEGGKIVRWEFSPIECD